MGATVPHTLGHLGAGRFGLVAYGVAMLAAVVWAVRRMSSAARRPDRDDRARNAYLVGGIVALAFTMAEPVDRYADRLFWVHMSQHVVLMTVAAPLIALGAPWRFAPRSVRTWWTDHVGTGSPIVPAAIAAWLVFNGAFLAFHAPFLYDAAIRHVWVHVIEHAVFLATAVWFWAAAFDARSFTAHPSELWRAGYVLGAAGVGWFLAIVLTFAPDPLYHEYARLGSRPGGISAMADQQLAAGVMLVPGSITFLLVAGIVLTQWLAREPMGVGSEMSGRHEGLGG